MTEDCYKRDCKMNLASCGLRAEVVRKQPANLDVIAASVSVCNPQSAQPHPKMPPQKPVPLPAKEAGFFKTLLVCRLSPPFDTPF